MKKFNDSETATVLAALRYFQANHKQAVAATQELFEDAPALSPKKIDALCETLNTEGAFLSEPELVKIEGFTKGKKLMEG